MLFFFFQWPPYVLSKMIGLDHSTDGMEIRRRRRRANTQITYIHVHIKTKKSYVSSRHISHTKHTLLDLFNVCSNHTPLNYSGQESKNNLQFIILTPVTLK